jgi:hypothetical protein
MTYRTADRVISPNDSYKSIAMERGGRGPSEGNCRSQRTRYPSHATHLSRTSAFDGSGFSLVYLGIMGPQDSVEVILDVMDELVHRRSRTDVQATLLGLATA